MAALETELDKSIRENNSTFFNKYEKYLFYFYTVCYNLPKAGNTCLESSFMIKGEAIANEETGKR
ncbi:hypothetical protein J21TS7_41670 [Paenibacillus cineris]|uniref:Uncharacterized protein n=1 Tax=Paenibacillus cineris TaxID=237530 RepID=A0ABQ4LH50_9BACL|nr:hypothetical protein J21TS7_41670 [Paenibacillus cineris]